MKLKHFQEHLKKENIDIAFFMHPDPTFIYFTQMEPSHGILIITPNECFFWLSALDKKPSLKEITILPLKKGWEKNLPKVNVRKIAVNKELMTLQQWEKVQKLFSKAHPIDISHFLHTIRKEKTSLELQRMRVACHITSEAFHTLLKELPKKNLRTEQDVAFFLEKYIYDHGATLAFPTITAMGKNAATPHHKTSLTKLSQGFLLVDFGAKYQNYCADMTRVIYLGNPSSKEKDLYDLLLRAQIKAINSVQNKMSFLELDKVVRTELGNYAKSFIHSLGHGIGIEVHESPVFSDKKEKIIPNVPFTIEPGIYLPEKLGLRIEDTVIWDGKKVDVLTKATKELIRINDI